MTPQLTPPKSDFDALKQELREVYDGDPWHDSSITSALKGIDAGTAVRAVDVFAEFERNLVPFKKLVHEAIDQVDTERTCTHCLPHDGVELPFDLP